MKRLLSIGVLNGVVFAAGMGGIDILAYRGFRVMGSEATEIARVAETLFAGDIGQRVALSILCYLVVFVAEALLLRAALALAFPALSGRRLFVALLGAQAAAHFLFFLDCAFRWPQLFEEFIAAVLLGGAFPWLSSRLGPWAPRAIAAALVVAWTLRLMRRIPWGRVPVRAATNSTLLVGLGLTSALMLAGPSTRATGDAGKAVQVILIGVDSLRSDRLLPTPGVESPMPFLSALAAERGIVFPNTYVQIPRTFPSWVSILSSTYPKQNSVRTMFPTVEDRAHPPAMLPRLLAERGFATAVYSDFAGDIFPRYDFGFAEVHAPTLNFLSLIQLRLLEATPQLLPYLETSWGRRFFPQIRELASHALPELLTDEAIEGMERNAAAGRPGFSLVFYSTAHFPYAAPYPAYRRWARPDYGGPNRFQRASNFSGHASEADVKQLRGLYDGALWAIDRELARMVEALRAKGLDRQTILVVTADHGENLYEGELGIGHGDHLLGEASLRVPLAVIDLRETKPAPRVEERVVRSLDLAPTLLGRLGLAPPASFQGVDLLAPGNSGSLPALTETELWFVEHSDEPYQALRFPYPSVDRTTRLRPDHDFEIELQPRYRDLVYFAKHLSYLSGGDRLVYMPMRPRPQWRLYDVGADPLSARDLAATRPERLRALKTEMLALMSRMAPVEERGGYVFWQEPR